MIKVSGKAAFRGIAIGPIKEIAKKDNTVRCYSVEDAEAECVRFQNAQAAAIEELQKLYEKAVKEVGEENAAIFEVHQMMTEDEDYCDSVYDMIRTEQVNAEYAVAVTGDNFATMFAEMDDDYMRERAADVREFVAPRILSVGDGTDTWTGGDSIAANKDVSIISLSSWPASMQVSGVGVNFYTSQDDSTNGEVQGYNTNPLDGTIEILGIDKPNGAQFYSEIHITTSLGLIVIPFSWGGEVTNGGDVTE